jgi:formate dehydrogenase major subunit
MWTVGYTGQTPERMKRQIENLHTFDKTTLKAKGGPCDGEFYGLPWPCWGTGEMGHPGSHILYDNSTPVAEGGSPFRARFGVERDGVNLLAEGSSTVGAEIDDGYPEFTSEMLKELGWWDDLTDAEKAEADGKSWKTDLSGGIQRVAIKHGCAPYGNAKARAVVWQFPDPVPVHREALYTNRHDLTEKYPTYEDRRSFYRLPTRYGSIQETDFSKDFPLLMTSGRLVEYEGGGEETRSNPWLAELQQDMFIEINPADANDNGIRDEEMVWVEGPEGGQIKVKAMVTERVGRGTVFMPFHFGGIYQGQDLTEKYPEGTVPHVLGESCNTIYTYGYDSVTMMQESKVSLCRVRAA